jgi:hypothetical protein
MMPPRLIDEIGNRLVNDSVARDTPWQFDLPF